MRNPNCDKCGLCERVKSVCVWGAGDGPGFVIGEAPGAEEDRRGVPFQGSAGKVLKAALRAASVDAYITNVVKCRPPKNRKPEREEVKACREYLDSELEERNPKAVLLLGATAMKAAIGKTKVNEMNGQVVEKDGRAYVCCFHPAYVLRDPSKEAGFNMAVRRYAAVLNGAASYDEPEDWRVVTRHSFDDFIADFESCESMAWDLETTGLDWWNKDFRVQVASFCFDGAIWVLPLNYKSIMPYHAQRDLLAYMCDNAKSKQVITHNGKFDNLCLMAQYGIRFPITFDTMLAHYALDENSGHSLKLLAREYANAPDYDIALSAKRGQGPETLKFFKYAAYDAYYTWKLEYVFRRQLELDPDTLWIFNKILMPCQRMFEDVEFNGLFINVNKLNKTERETEKALRKVERQLNRMVGHKVNWNSPDQVAKVLYGELGLMPSVLTPKGKPSTSEVALADLVHPITKKLEEFRGLQKFLSTYIKGWREFMVGPYLHLSTKIHGTVTGRFSSRLHQVPRDGTIRNLVEAPKGWTFVQVDLSQAEVRVAGIMSSDPELLECYRKGVDVHWRTLMNVFRTGEGGEYESMIWDTVKADGHKPKTLSEAIDLLEVMGHERATQIDKRWKEGRKKAKGINFGFIYGMGPPKFVEYAKVQYGFDSTLEEAEMYRQAFFNLYVMLLTWHKRQRRLAKMQGFVHNLFGRKRRLPAIHSPDRQAASEAERQAINAPVQGFIGDFKAVGMLEVHGTFKPSEVRIVGEVHDSILMWVRTTKLDRILPRVRKIVEHPKVLDELGMKLPIPLQADFEVGPWGNGTTWRG